MTYIKVIKELNTLKPYTLSDSNKIQELSNSEPILLKVKHDRNAKLHNQYFALLNLVYQNQDKFSHFDTMRKILEMKSGYYTMAEFEHEGKKHKLALPRSISYDSLSGKGFEELYDKVMETVEDFFGIDQSLLLNELRNE